MNAALEDAVVLDQVRQACCAAVELCGVLIGGSGAGAAGWAGGLSMSRLLAVQPCPGTTEPSSLPPALLCSLQLLESAGEDLASVPAAFTAARLPDARALLWLDSNASERNGTSRWGRLHPLAVASGASMLYRSLLTKATGGWVRPNALAVMNDLGRPYREVQAQVWRDNLLLGTLGLPAAAPVALLAAAAAGADRLRA